MRRSHKREPIPTLGTLGASKAKLRMPSDSDRKRFWRTFIAALEAEPTDVGSLVGASGFEHPVLAAGVDRARERLVIVSSEPSARVAALAQADIQGSLGKLRVVMARPIALNLAAVASVLTDSLGTVRLGQRELALAQQRPKVFERAMKRFVRKNENLVKRLLFQANQIAELDLLTVWQEVLQQISLVDFEPNADLMTEESLPDYDVELGRIVALDPAEHDRRQGVCSVPLYDFQYEEIEIFHRGRDIEAAKEILRRHQLIQYFFPTPDHVALGLVGRDRQPEARIAATVGSLPHMGHPLAKNEIVDPVLEVAEVIQALKDKGYVAEGEFGVEITSEGRKVRQTVQFKPREGIFAKIARVLSVKIDLNLRDLFK